jgi:hypothetical protein
MSIATKLDEGGRFAWSAAMIAGFIIFWPIGLAILAYMLWSGRMGCRNYAYANGAHDEWRSWRDEWRSRKREMREKFWAERNRVRGAMSGSGNSAFDDYKAETLRRLEEEQAQFNEFLENLRRSRDKAEFEQFMQSRRNTTSTQVSDIEPYHGGEQNGQ